MKKIFKLKNENKNKDRLLDAIKYEIRKYIKREKRKTLPDGVDYWDLKCKFAKNDDEPKHIDFVEITNLINEAAEQDCDSFYLEIIATEGKREKKVYIKPEDEVVSFDKATQSDEEDKE